MRFAEAGPAPDIDKAVLFWQMIVYKGREGTSLKKERYSKGSFVATVDDTVADAQCISFFFSLPTPPRPRSMYFLNYVLKV